MNWPEAAVACAGIVVGGPSLMFALASFWCAVVGRDPMPFRRKAK